MQQISRISSNGHTHSRNAPPERFQTSVLDGWPRLTFFFRLDGAHRREDSTVAIHGIVKKRGCPTRRVYAWGFVSYRPNRSGQRTKTGINDTKNPTHQTDVWATQIISSRGVRTTRHAIPLLHVPVNRVFRKIYRTRFYLPFAVCQFFDKPFRENGQGAQGPEKPRRL